MKMHLLIKHRPQELLMPLRRHYDLSVFLALEDRHPLKEGRRGLMNMYVSSQSHMLLEVPCLMTRLPLLRRIYKEWVLTFYHLPRYYNAYIPLTYLMNQKNLEKA